MTVSTRTESYVKALGMIVVAGLLVMGAQISARATTACQQPKQNSLKYCVEAGGGAIQDCSTAVCGPLPAFYLEERNKFPNGTEKSASGTTATEAADCYRTQACVVDPNNSQKCVASGTWSVWVLEDKTVVGKNACPTKEE